jgi:hypothetical protein
MTDFLSKNQFSNYALKNRFTIKIKIVHVTYRNIKILLKVIQIYIKKKIVVLFNN